MLRITYSDVARQLTKKKQFPATSSTTPLAPTPAALSQTMSAQPAKARKMPPSRRALGRSMPSQMARAAVKIGCDGCQIEPATGLLSFRPTMKASWLPKMKSPRNANSRHSRNTSTNRVGVHANAAHSKMGPAQPSRINAKSSGLKVGRPKAPITPPVPNMTWVAIKAPCTQNQWGGAWTLDAHIV